MGTRLVAGRLIDDSPDEGPVVVVNEAFVERVRQGRNALGATPARRPGPPADVAGRS